MKDSLIIRILLIFLCFLLIVVSVSFHAGAIDSLTQDLEPGEIIEVPNQMTQKEMNDLFGEDPYLGQTSYLQSPEGYSQRVNSK